MLNLQTIFRSNLVQLKIQSWQQMDPETNFKIYLRKQKSLKVLYEINFWDLFANFINLPLKFKYLKKSIDQSSIFMYLSVCLNTMQNNPETHPSAQNW